MIRHILVAALLAGLLTTRVTPAPAPKDSPDFYPTLIGTCWVYDIDNGNGELALRVAAVEEKDGAKVVTVEKRGTTGWFPHERVKVSARGPLLVEFNGYTIEPYYLLKYPIKARDTWQIEYPFQVGLTGIKGTVTVLGEEEVKVPAGTFKAVKLERVITEENGKLLAKPLKITVWFARGVGRVKVVPSEGTHLELLSFTPGNK